MCTYFTLLLLLLLHFTFFELFNDFIGVTQSKRIFIVSRIIIPTSAVCDTKTVKLEPLLMFLRSRNTTACPKLIFIGFQRKSLAFGVSMFNQRRC